jgi:hypothetical protein
MIEHNTEKDLLKSLDGIFSGGRRKEEPPASGGC